MLLLEVNDPGETPNYIVGNMILTKHIRLDIPTTTFFVQINDYGKGKQVFKSLLSHRN